MKPLLFEISENEDERWGFHYFRDRTSGQILSFADRGFWNRLVIQAGYSRGIVRHALVAIGSYHESVDHPDPLRRSNRQQIALQQYSRAIKGILRSGPNADTEDVLLTSILFTFFENVRGEWSTALNHLYSGFRILTDWRASHQFVNGKTESSSVVEEHLAPILEHLHVSATSLMPLIPSKRKQYLTTLPDRFDSLQDSRFYFYELIHAICGRLESVHETLPWPQTDERIIEDGRALLTSWYALYNKYLNETPTRSRLCSCCLPSSSCHFELGSCHLQMQYWTAMIRLNCKHFRSELKFDAEMPNFRTLIRLTESLVEKLDSKEADGVGNCLGFDTHYLPIAGFIALRCRDPVIRRRAIEMMRSRRRTEGKWDHNVAADVAEFVMIQEEVAATVPEPSSCHEIPDESRLHILSCSFFSWNRINNKFEMLVGRIRLNNSLTNNCSCYDFLNPELIKFRAIRSGICPADQELETFWIDRRLSRSVDMHKPELPKDVVGLFPQTIEIESKLWHVLGGKKIAELLERATASHICKFPQKRSTVFQERFLRIPVSF